jgi:Fe-S-cluster containining protein
LLFNLPGLNAFHTGKAMSEHIEDQENICLSCGACCAAYRVSFYWSEAKELGLEDEMTEMVNSWRACMAGTNRRSPLCRGLQGIVGRQVFCLVYAKRPAPCRELQPGDDKCNRARIRHGLDTIPPSPEDAVDVGEFRN